MSAAFDPARHLRMLRGKGGPTPYLDVAWRIAWLRAAHPEAIIETAAVEIDPAFACVDEHGQLRGRGRAVFRASVLIPGLGSATGYGSETADDFGDHLERAETKALGRALLALGFSAEFVPAGQRRMGGRR